MTQLILDIGGAAVSLPESIKGGYFAYEDDLSKESVMISGRMVKDVRGVIWRVSYQYGYFSDEMKQRVLAACRSGRKNPIICSFLPPEENGDKLITSSFWVIALKEPRFMWGSAVKTESGENISRPLWADFSVELREVRPHDR